MGTFSRFDGRWAGQDDVVDGSLLYAVRVLLVLLIRK